MRVGLVGSEMCIRDRCACARAREREQMEREIVCVCVYVRARAPVCVCVRASVRAQLTVSASVYVCSRDLVYRRALPIQKHILVDIFPWWRCTCCPEDSVRSETDSWGPAVLRHTLQHVTGITSSAVKLTAGALPSCVTLCNSSQVLYHRQ